MPHVLVTGGCGFIGSHFVRRLLTDEGWFSTLPGASAGLRVTNLDALTYAGNPENVADVAADRRYRFVKGDIANSADVVKAMAEFDGMPVTHIVNFAAESHVDRSIEDASPFLRANFIGVQVMLENARKLLDNEGENAFQRFVQVSTDEVYGSLGPTGLFTEESPLDPSSPYSAAKTGGDLMAFAYERTFGVPVVVTRCSNNYGPYQYPEKLIPLFILNASNDRPLPIYGDGGQIRDWIYVEDHAEGVLQAMLQGKAGQAYNFGANCERTNLQITREILARLDKPETLIEYVEDRLGHDRRYAIDSSKAKEHLGWTPKVGFEEGIARTVSWYRDREEVSA